MGSKGFWRSAKLVAAAVLQQLAFFGDTAAEAAKPPNILFIMSDDQGVVVSNSERQS